MKIWKVFFKNSVNVWYIAVSEDADDAIGLCAGDYATLLSHNCCIHEVRSELNRILSEIGKLRATEATPKDLSDMDLDALTADQWAYLTWTRNPQLISRSWYESTELMTDLPTQEEAVRWNNL